MTAIQEYKEYKKRTVNLIKGRRLVARNLKNTTNVLFKEALRLCTNNPMTAREISDALNGRLSPQEIAANFYTFSVRFLYYKSHYEILNVAKGKGKLLLARQTSAQMFYVDKNGNPIAKAPETPSSKKTVLTYEYVPYKNVE